MNDSSTTIAQLKKIADDFIQERDWQQYHDPKNDVMNLACEVAELLEHFRWVDNKNSIKQVEQNRTEIEHEAADVLFALLCFCNYSKIDLAIAFEKKIQITAQKYPIEKFKGKAEKYSKL
jgi:NTP pyrophosphatase (non-canonical NTP hydrolase)